jgi:hypothetical protein
VCQLPRSMVLRELTIGHIFIPGHNSWRRQLACADVLSVTPNFGPPAHKGSHRGLPLFLVTRTGHTLRWMVRGCSSARFKLHGLHPRRWNKSVARAL